MKTYFIFLVFLLCTLKVQVAFAQEWKNLKTYREETGISVLTDGCWLEKDRKQENEVWQRANEFNLSIENGHKKYTTITQIRDFYRWFDEKRKQQGHEIQWIGIAGIVANQLSNIDRGFIRTCIVRNKEVVQFANDGCLNVLKFAFPQLRAVYFSSELLTGPTAENWDVSFGRNEQCVILEPLYQQLSSSAIQQLDKMAKGRGVFALAVKNEFKYVGSVKDCQTRYEHGMKTLRLVYEQNSQ